MKLQMALLRSYIKSAKLEHTVRKNTAMISLYSHRWRQQQSGFGSSSSSTRRNGGDGGGSRAVRAADLVKLHDTLLQNAVDAQALQGASNDVGYQNRFRFKHSAFSTARCFYVAEALYGQQKYTEALAVCERGLQMHASLVRVCVCACVRVCVCASVQNVCVSARVC